MAKASSLDTELAQARRLADRPPADLTDAEIRSLLASKHGMVASKGAQLTAEAKRETLIPDLLRAFDRFLVNGEKTDRGCVGKFAAINALCALDHRDGDLYRRGLHVIQLEASFGPRVDSAAELRGRCAIALAECGAPRAILDIVPLLVESQPQARLGAARAIGAFGSEEAAAILRLKVLTGDPEPIVLAECCLALLHISIADHAPFLIPFLQTSDDALTIDFVTNLTESRDPAILPIIQALYPTASSPSVRKAILSALALMRIDGALEFLLELLTTELHARAMEALDALRVRRADDRLRTRLEAAITQRNDPALLKHYRAVFDA